MSAYANRRWAEMARELEFQQLPELRRQAEGWRTGLTGLTALVAVLAVLKGRDSLAELPGWARALAMGLVLGAFVLLVIGALVAVRASHGLPGEEIYYEGQALRRWTERECVRVSGSIRAAAVLCLSGLLLVTAAVAVSWAATPEKPEKKGGKRAALVRVTPQDTGKALCGRLVSVTPQRAVVRTHDGTRRTVRGAVTVKPARTCP
ncbi:hypothetical protein GCM10009801_76850 [Streptomyces albiaxialis]|uniref:Integral membrane protein n=1 Tax=Streptomyces albiaxialis TaxID=329523 RepID=A0ABP5ILG8_9ACTN